MVGECKLMCKKPYIKNLHAHKDKLGMMLSADKRLDATPFGCGQCMHCRINKSREWTHRILLEASTSKDACFVTLTYQDDYLPKDKNVSKPDVQKYIKRLRRKIEPNKIKYFAVGEYGDVTFRPHYHIVLFNLGIKNTAVITSTWAKGFAQIAELNKDTARYITGYITGKLKDKDLYGREKEFMLCSTGSKESPGGIGLTAIDTIARKLISNPYFEKRIVKELHYGKSKLPLGRYLTRKLAEKLDIKEWQFGEEFLDYQEEIFKKHLTQDSTFYKNLLEENKGSRDSQIAKSKIRKQRRRI